MSELIDWPVHSLLAQFRPDPGWEVDRACFASYSADVRVVTAALLALGGHAGEPELGSRVQLIQAFRKLRGRVNFVVQRGRIHWPRNLPKVAALLDRFLFEARCNERVRSWHPKFALMRWRRPDDGAITWRAWLGSRNLTRDLSRDAGLLLTEETYPASGHALPDFARAVKALQLHLPQRAGRFTEADLEAVSAVRWAPPKGIGAMNVHWLDGARDAFPKPNSQRRAIVISPFVDAASMKAASGWMQSGKKPVLLAAEPELARVCAQAPKLTTELDLCTFATAPEEGAPYEPATPEANVDAGDAERELDRSDEARAYHAKLIYLRSGNDKRLWLGSPNLTQRAWSRNFEIVAELTAAGRDPWGAVLEDLAKHASRFEPASVVPAEKKDLVEELRKILCVDLQCHQERSGDSVTLVATHWPEAPEDRVEVLVGLPWVERKPLVWDWGRERLSLGELKLDECSDFLLFIVRKGEDECGWLMQAQFRPTLKADRDSAAVASYLGPDGYLNLIKEEMESAKSGAPPWDAPNGGHGDAGARVNFEIGLPTLEGLLRLSLREPERLIAVASTVAMLETEVAKWDMDDALAGQQRLALAAFRRLWKEVGEPLTEKARGTDA